MAEIHVAIPFDLILRTLMGHAGPVWTVAVKNNVLVTGSQDKTVCTCLGGWVGRWMDEWIYSTTIDITYMCRFEYGTQEIAVALGK